MPAAHSKDERFWWNRLGVVEIFKHSWENIWRRTVYEITTKNPIRIFSNIKVNCKAIVKSIADADDSYYVSSKLKKV